MQNAKYKIQNAKALLLGNSPLRTKAGAKVEENRDCKKFVVIKAMTERYKRSSIPSMQRLLNKSEKERNDMMKIIKNTVPVNHDYCNPITVKIKPP